MYTIRGDQEPFEFSVNKPTEARDNDGRPVELGDVELSAVESSDVEGITLEVTAEGEDGVATYRATPGSAAEDGSPRPVTLTCNVTDKGSGEVVAQFAAPFRVAHGKIAMVSGGGFSFPTLTPDPEG